MDRDKIQQLINERGIKSVEELQALINEVSAQQNALGRPEFLGLSLNQMRWMLYEPFEPESPFGFKVASDETLNEVPFLRICEAMLKHTVLQQSPFKLTESTGSLPVKVVKAVYETGGYRDPNIEEGIAYWFGLAEEIQPARYLPAKTPAVVQKSEILDDLFRFPKLEA